MNDLILAAQSIFTKLTDYVFSTQFLIVLVPVVLFGVYEGVKHGIERPLSRRSVTGSLASLAILFLNILLLPFIAFMVGIFTFFYDRLGIPMLDDSVWHGIPFWLVGLIVVIGHDFCDYWNHRLMHMKWIWPVHAIHHSDEEVNALTTFRVHAFEAIIMRSSYVLLLSWLAVPVEAAAFGGGIWLMHNMYVHMNMDWDHGPLRKVIASPAFHRWHHANEPAAFGKNLANLLSLWDWLFGTYYFPKLCREEMGATGVPHADVPALMAYPLTEWTRMVKSELGQNNPTPLAQGGNSVTQRSPLDAAE